jgi:hypothetical protein
MSESERPYPKCRMVTGPAFRDSVLSLVSTGFREHRWHSWRPNISSSRATGSMPDADWLLRSKSLGRLYSRAEARGNDRNEIEDEERANY